MQNDQSGCRKYFVLTDFAQFTFRSQKNGLKMEKNLMPHWIFQKVLMRNTFLILNGLRVRNVVVGYRHKGQEGKEVKSKHPKTNNFIPRGLMVLVDIQQ